LLDVNGFLLGKAGHPPEAKRHNRGKVSGNFSRKHRRVIVSIVRVGLGEERSFAAGYEAIFGGGSTKAATKTAPKATVKEAKKPAAKAAPAKKVAAKAATKTAPKATVKEAKKPAAKAKKKK
jgi:hypothetical protein